MRVLVVEDNASMAALLRRGLDEQGYAVDTVADAPSAVHMATEIRYDVIILDVVLGPPTATQDGFYVCQALREAGQWSPVIMLTARDAVVDRVHGLDVGADDYVTKPFSFNELLARVRAAIRRGGSPRPAVLAVGDLRLDPVRHEARRGGTAIDLTAKEFALLECFMRHAGAVLSRTDLLERVWDFAFDSDSNVVDVHVRNLRAKIDKPFGHDSVETVRGVGYRLRDESLAPGPA